MLSGSDVQKYIKVWRSFENKSISMTGAVQVEANLQEQLSNHLH